MKSQKTLFLSLSGIGNLIMQLPAIHEYKRKFPATSITVWTAPRGTSQIARACDFIDEVFTAPISRSLLLQLGIIRNLQTRNFDTAIMLSPGQLWKGALHLLLSGIPNRIGHTYPHLGNPESSFLLTESMPEDENLHDLEQNLKLISLVTKSAPPIIDHYTLTIPAIHHAKAARYIASLKSATSQTIIGLHPGSATGFSWKRWPASRFASIAKHLAEKTSAFILIFGGPEELKLQKTIYQAVGKNNAAIVKADLLTTAAIMTHSQLFISNDSGLMHLAANANVTTIGLFGPTDEQKTGPRGQHSHTLRAPGTKPVYNTETNPTLEQKTHPSLLALQESDLLNLINRLLGIP